MLARARLAPPAAVLATAAIGVAVLDLAFWFTLSFLGSSFGGFALLLPAVLMLSACALVQSPSR